MEYKKALEIPFKVDKDHVVSMTFLFSVFFFSLIASHLSNILKSVLLLSLCIKSCLSRMCYLCKKKMFYIKLRSIVISMR